MKNILFGSICLSLAASIWGGMYVVSKYLLNDIPPITLVWLRYAIAMVVLSAILKMDKQRTNTPNKITKRDLFLFGWIGFIGYFISIYFQFFGTKLSDAHTGALITSATPAFIVIFARFILKEALNTRKISSILLATIGVVIIVGWDTDFNTHFWGSILLVGAAITWALLSVYVKVASYNHSALTITTYAIFFALLFTTPFMLWEVAVHKIPFHNIPVIVLGILYLGIIATAGAFFLWNKGMEMMDAGIGSLFFFFQPIVGSFLGWFILGERLDWNFYIGGALILIAVLVVTLRKKDKQSSNLTS